MDAALRGHGGAGPDAREPRAARHGGAGLGPHPHYRLVGGGAADSQPRDLSNALRASLAGWSKTLASEVAKDGVTVNLVLPGRVETDRVGELDAINAKVKGKTPEEIAAAARAAIPAKRYGTVREFADVVCFLASERASYITGSM